jgi:type II secretory pathway pseudopilin PulG
MHARIVVVVVAILVGLPAWAVAQDAEALRREIEQMRQQMQNAQREYQKALDVLTERLQRLESRPQQAATAPIVVQAPPGPAPPSLTDLARPRQPFGLYGERRQGQFLLDIGVVADFVGNITQRNVEKAQGGTFFGRENRFFPREIELNLFGQIDPYARGEVRIEAAEEFEEGARELHVGLAEANLTLLTLPYGTQAKLGLMRNRFGLLNERHREALPQTDQPNVLTRFLGEEGLNESGAEVTWVAPLPFYLEALAGVFNGDNEDAFGRGSLKAPLVTGRLRTFFELGDAHALQLGVSGASGETPDRRRSTLAGADLKYKLTPEGWRHALLTVAGEALYSNRRVDVFDDAGAGEDRTRKRFGWYAYAEVQPWRRWMGGVRYDWTQFPVDPGREWAVEPYLAFLPSEFLRFRLAYKHTDRSHRVMGPDDRGSARVFDEILFQATFFLGAHPAHPF